MCIVNIGWRIFLNDITNHKQSWYFPMCGYIGKQALRSSEYSGRIEHPGRFELNTFVAYDWTVATERLYIDFIWYEWYY